MKIKIYPRGIEIEGDSTKSLMQICHENGIKINSICKGQPKCAECRVKIIGGEQNILPPLAAELSVLGNNFFLDGRRLSCQVRAYGDISVDITEQEGRTAASHKKVRGFRSTKPQESHAVLDTFILENEKPADVKSGNGQKKTGPSQGPVSE